MSSSLKPSEKSARNGLKDKTNDLCQKLRGVQKTSGCNDCSLGAARWSRICMHTPSYICSDNRENLRGDRICMLSVQDIPKHTGNIDLLDFVDKVQ